MRIKPDERKVLNLLKEFGPLKQGQIVRYFDNKLFGNVETILKNLKRRRLVSYNRALYQYYPAGWRKGDNAAMIKAFYVYLELLNTVDNVTLADYPGQLCFIWEGQLYEIAAAPIGQEAFVLRWMEQNPETNYLLVLDDVKQAEWIDAPNVSGVCTVTAGTVKFYVQEEDENENEYSDRTAQRPTGPN